MIYSIYSDSIIFSYILILNLGSFHSKIHHHDLPNKTSPGCWAVDSVAPASSAFTSTATCCILLRSQLRLQLVPHHQSIRKPVTVRDCFHFHPRLNCFCSCLFLSENLPLSISFTILVQWTISCLETVFIFYAKKRCLMFGVVPEIWYHRQV